MTVLNNIRKQGIILMVVLGSVLFLFVAEAFFQSLSVSFSKKANTALTINNYSLDAQEYQEQVNNYTALLKLQNPSFNASEEQQTQINNQVYQTLVQQQLVSQQASKLGLKVSSEELKAVLLDGTHPLLTSLPFKNKDGRFSLQILQNFLTSPDGIEMGKGFWLYVEKVLEGELLSRKFNGLLFSELPIKSVLKSGTLGGLVAYLPLVESGDGVLEQQEKEFYDQTKKQYFLPQELRGFSYFDVEIQPSVKDKEELVSEMDQARLVLLGSDFERQVRNYSSVFPYAKIPLGKADFTAKVLDFVNSTPVGSVSSVFEDDSDKTLNVLRVLGVVNIPDSIEYAQVFLQTDKEVLEAEKDLQNGKDFLVLAKEKQQPNTKNWFVYSAFSKFDLNADYVKYIKSLLDTSVGGVQKVKLSQGVLLVKVYDKRSYSQKYDVALIKRPVVFSKDTYAKAYNKFSSFVAANPTLDKLKENAPRFGYSLNTRSDVSASEQSINGLGGTKVAFRWLFEADKNQVSPIYEVENGTHLLLVALTDIKEPGIQPFSEVQPFIKNVLAVDKKKEKTLSLVKGKTFEEISSMPNVVVDSISNVNFFSYPYVSKLNRSVPVIAGLSLKNKDVNQVSVADNFGIYVVNAKLQGKEEYSNLQNENYGIFQNYIQSLYNKSKIKDRRYLFF